MTKSSGNISPRSPIAAAHLKSCAPILFSRSNYRHSVPLKFFQDDKRPPDVPGFVSANIAFFQEKSGTSRQQPQLFFKSNFQKIQDNEGDTKKNWGYSPYAGNAAAVRTPDCSYMDSNNSPRNRKSSVPVTDLRKVFVYDSNGKAIPPKVRHETMDVIPSESYDDTGYNTISCGSDDTCSSDHDAISDDEDTVILMGQPFQSMSRLGGKRPTILITVGAEHIQDITSEKVDPNSLICSPRSILTGQLKNPAAANTRSSFPSAHSSPSTPLADALSQYFSAPFPNPVTPATSFKSFESPVEHEDLETDGDLCENSSAAEDPLRNTTSMFSSEGFSTRRRSVKEIVDSWGVKHYMVAH